MLPASASPMSDVAARPASRSKKRRVNIDVRVDAGDWPPQSVLSTLAHRVVDAAVAALGPVVSGEGELSLLFTDDAHMRALNRRYRNIDRATNVLSFPAAVPADGQIGGFLGDIAVASETLRREAMSRDLTIEAHLSHLLLHGFLHVLGYDHEDEAEASVMERLETGILGELGIADPYAGPR
jgi:probable rRNA maturation factor